MSWSTDRQNGKVYLYHKEPKIDWGGGGGGQKEGEHGKLLHDQNRKGLWSSKTVKFWGRYNGNFESIETIHQWCTKFRHKDGKANKSISASIVKRNWFQWRDWPWHLNTCDKNGYLSEKSYSEDETSSIDLFSKTLTTASQDQNSSEWTSSKKR